MKKLLFSLTLVLTLLCGTATLCFAEGSKFSIPDTGELKAECGADGFITMHLYVSDDNNDSITRIVFFDVENNEEYFYKFDPVNYEDDNLWTQRINIPKGEYIVSCRVTGDAYGAIRCELFPKGRLTVGDMLETVICFVGPDDWIAGMQEHFANATPTPRPGITATPVPTVTEKPEEVIDTPVTEAVKPTEAPVATMAPDSPEEIPEHIDPEPEPEEDKSPVGIILGALALILVSAFLLKKKKK